MKAFLHYEERAPHQLAGMRALAEGLARHGVHVDISNNWYGLSDFVVWWGDKVPATMRDRPQLILEAGYINGWSGDYVRDRLRFVSTGWNGLHGRADSGRLDHPPDRWEALDTELQPWRSDGKFYLICDQHPGDSAASTDRAWWKTLDQWGRPDICSPLRLVYRPHPLLAPDLRPLEQSLVDAAVCVTWNSTCAIQAVIMGVPCIAMDEGSAAWAVTSHELNGPLYLGEREQWAYNLAYRQWTHDELADGSAWEVLKHGIENSNRA